MPRPADVAQLVEQRIHKPRVTGSSPVIGIAERHAPKINGFEAAGRAKRSPGSTTMSRNAEQAQPACPSRRGGRVAEGNGLLNRRTGITRTAGSNPALSATLGWYVPDAPASPIFCP